MLKKNCCGGFFRERKLSASLSSSVSFYISLSMNKYIIEDAINYFCRKYIKKINKFLYAGTNKHRIFSVFLILMFFLNKSNSLQCVECSLLPYA